LKACKAKGWHTAIETSGFTTKAVIDEVFPYVDLALTDIKAIDPEIHERNTGVNNRVILENLLRISFLTKVVVRIPVIPGVNDNSQEIHNIAEFARLMQNVDTIHLLPYHSFGENKYNLLGRQYPMGDTKSIEEAQMAELKAMVESLGFNCHIGG
ncbi:radical SAM protein, partial [Escherichia coli]|nr:radical SAM protein [Escherichia coli]